MANDDDDLRRAAEGRVFFSHHSVGGNLLAGVMALAAEAAARTATSGQTSPALRLIALDDAERTPGPGWVHGAGGQNGQPLGKIAFFAETLNARPASSPSPDLAFMKFCYVDFTPHTDVDKLFGVYQQTLHQLQGAHPRTTFGHVTVPLTRRPRDAKARAMRLLGRPVWEDGANVKRLAFNQRLQRLHEQSPGQPLFDLARHESTLPDGSRETFSAGGGMAYALAPVYTDDGGHLNGVGRRVMASHLLRFVAGALASRR